MIEVKEVSFDFMAKCITEKVKPQETDINVYVGLEHLDADSLKIQRRGTPDDVIGEKIHALPGDIIFGKRRAYQRKLGITDVECIASAHSMVLRAKPKNIVPEFLPYFMQSDIFMERAVKISEGSLSPTIKWKAMAKERFVIPDCNRQKEIAELMSAFDESIEAKKQMIGKINKAKDTISKKEFGENLTETPCTLRDLVNIEYGFSLPEQLREGGDIPVYGSNGIVGYHCVGGLCGKGIILGRKGSIDKVTWVEGKYIPIDTTYYLVPRPNVQLKWIYYYLLTIDLRSLNAATGVPSLNRNTLYELKLCRHCEEKQLKIIQTLEKLESAIVNVQETKNTVSSLKKQVFEKLLNGG